MDDFLHNLRTGKNKSTDRGRRNFDNPAYKGGDRQGGRERPKGPAVSPGISPEQLSALTVTLKDIAESYSRVAETSEEMTRTTLRQTELMEQLLEAVRERQHIPPVTAIPIQITAPPPPPPDTSRLRESSKSSRREELREQIEVLHAEGLSFKKIAARLQAEGILTLSGKGQWHGRSVSRIINGDT